MRKIIMINRVSVDGFFAGPNGELDWLTHDPEVDKAWHKLGGQADTILFGDITYQLFESVWPKIAMDPNAPKESRPTFDFG